MRYPVLCTLLGVLLSAPPSVAQSSSLDDSAIEYRIVRQQDGLFEGLVATLGEQTYSIASPEEEMCLNVVDQRDFDGDGTIDALIENVTACGGNCCGNSYFFVTHEGEGRFQRSGEFGYSWTTPEVELWQGQWSIAVTSETGGGRAPSMISQRFILDDGQYMKVDPINESGSKR